MGATSSKSKEGEGETYEEEEEDVDYEISVGSGATSWCSTGHQGGIQQVRNSSLGACTRTVKVCRKTMLK